jgi:hypothetical protein
MAGVETSSKTSRTKSLPILTSKENMENEKEMVFEDVVDEESDAEE